MEKCQKLTKGHNSLKIMTPENLKLHAHFQIIAKHSAQYQVSPIMNLEVVVGPESKSAWVGTPAKSQIKILKPHAYFRIIRRECTKFQINLMKDVGLAEANFRTYSVCQHGQSLYQA